MKAMGLTILLTVLLAACAQVRDPTGGPKDGSPPVLVHSDPTNGTTRFSGTRISLEFSERVRLDRVRNNLFISPPLSELPEVRQNGASRISLDLSTPLAPNTTYVFNFGGAVVDLTESNPAENLVLVLSTGDRIDSLVLNGTVRNAYSGAMEKGVSVLLFAANDTASFSNGQPLYFARTGVDGNYQLPYLATGTYLIRALRDQNGNHRYDLPNEEIGFLSVPVHVIPGDTLPLPPLRLFREQGHTQQLLNYRVVADRALELVLRRPADSLKLVPSGEGPRPEWSFTTSAGRDSILAWPSDTTLMDGVAFVLYEGTTVVDTIVYRVSGAMPFQLGVQVSGSDDRGIFVRTSRPIAMVDASRFQVIGDSAGPGEQGIALTLDSADMRSVQVAFLNGKRPVGHVRILPKAFRDIYGGWNDSLTVNSNGTDENSFGKVTLDLDRGPNEAVVLQLLEVQGRLVRTMGLGTNERTCAWDRLPPGAYELRMILDTNGNGLWDPGSLVENRPPEEVVTYPGSIQVRAGWEIGLYWKVENP